VREQKTIDDKLARGWQHGSHIDSLPVERNRPAPKRSAMVVKDDQRK
jgi:hypothetical protein